MLENKILIIVVVVMLVIGSLMVMAVTPINKINCPTETPTDTLVPTETSTPTPTETLVPTDTPTSTPTQDASPTFTLPPPPTDTPTFTPTPISTDTETPTSTETITPTNTATPTEYTPTPTSTNVPTSTPTIVPTDTPYPPMAADANSGIQNYPGKRLGVMQIDGVSYNLYQGSNKNGGSLLLPGGSIRGAAIYDNTIWLHRMWEQGWLSISLGSHINILYTNGKLYNYTVVNVSNKPYGTYFDGDLNIASCYSDDAGNWAGISLYQLKLVDSYYPDRRR